MSAFYMTVGAQHSMMMHKQLRHLLLVLMFTGSLSCGSRPREPQLEAETHHLQIEGNTPNATNDDKEVLLDYVLHNRGRAPLKFTKIQASCGCNRFWLEDELLDPGRSTHFFARVSRSFESKQVSFTLFSNDPLQPALRLTALIESSQQPPYVVRSRTMPVDFGPRARPGDSRLLTIFTHEEPHADAHWIERVVSDSADILATPMDQMENLSLTGEIVQRAYQFEIRLSPTMETGPFRSSLQLLDGHGQVVGIVFARGSVSRPIVVVPNSFVLPAKRVDTIEKRVLIRAVDASSDLRVEVDTEVPSGVEIDRVPLGSACTSFLIRIAPNVELGGSFDLCFRTNHVQQDRVAVRFLEYGSP